MFKRLVEYSSVIGVGSFIIYYSYLWIYYVAFGISIVNYIEFTEVLILLIPWVTIPACLIFLIMGFFSRDKITPISYNFLFYRKSLFHRLLIWIPIVCVIPTFFLDDLTNLNQIKLKNCLILVLMLSVFSALFVMSLKNYRKKIKNMGQVLIVGGFFILLVSVYSLGMRQGASNMIFRGSESQTVSFKYNTEVVVTDSFRRFLGETRSAMFIYNKKTNSTTVYLKRNIDSLVFEHY